MSCESGSEAPPPQSKHSALKCALIGEQLRCKSPGVHRLLADFDRGALAHVATYIDAMPARRDWRIRPHENIARVDRRQVHAAVAASGAEHVVPIRAVQRVA